MQITLNKCSENTGIYLLPIIRNKVAEKAGINIPLTLYVARYSWVSATKAKVIPLSVISEGLGHESKATTQIYLASLDISVLDKVNSIILKSIL